MALICRLPPLRLAGGRAAARGRSPTRWPRCCASTAGKIETGVRGALAGRARRPPTPSSSTSPPAPSPRSPATACPAGSRAPTAATGTGPAPSRSTSRSRAACPGRNEACRRAGHRPRRRLASRRSSPPSATSTAAACRSGRSSSSASSTSPTPSAPPATSTRSGPTRTCPAATTATPSEAVLDQIERFAPGLRERIVASAVRSPGRARGRQRQLRRRRHHHRRQHARCRSLIRPRLALDPYSTGIPGVFICSAATPPGAGAHGMGGYNAAQSALGWLRGRRNR